LWVPASHPIIRRKKQNAVSAQKGGSNQRKPRKEKAIVWSPGPLKSTRRRGRCSEANPRKKRIGQKKKTALEVKLFVLPSGSKSFNPIPTGERDQIRTQLTRRKKGIHPKVSRGAASRQKVKVPNPIRTIEKKTPKKEFCRPSKLCGGGEKKTPPPRPITRG